MPKLRDAKLFPENNRATKDKSIPDPDHSPNCMIQRQSDVDCILPLDFTAVETSVSHE